jgi:hypothetical protein
VPGAPSYDELVELAHREEDVLGLVVGGSRGKGAFVGHSSDYDVYLVVHDPEAYRRRFPTRHGDPVEVIALSLDELRAHAEIGSDTEWNRYTFAHVRPVVDKTGGELSRVVEEKGRLPPEAARRVAAEALDGYVNCYYRSAKNARAGLVLAAKLDAADSIPHLLTTLFALHERVRPYNKYLEWELERFPLGYDRWRADCLLPTIERIVATGDLDAQRQLFRAIEALARERGIGHVLDGWEPDVAWLRGDE